MKAPASPRIPRQPSAGEVVAGKYRLERMLKQGGMGSVWIATHLALDQRVALKFMDPRRVSSVDSRMRFTREAKAAAQIRSKNIVHILDHGVDEGVPYIAMELLEGEDLGVRLRRAGRLTMAQASALLNDIAHALDRAHAVGIVHRDLKPENIFLAKDGDDEIPKILDFGLAREVQESASDDSSATAEGVILGTPYFMSPEQVRGRSDIDHRSDLWSLGVILFRAITGIRPFGRGAPADIIVQICSDPIPRASVVARDLPEEVDKFFETALARDVSKRFSSAKEMAAAFADIAKLASSGERVQTDLGGDRAVGERIVGERIGGERAGSPKRVKKTPPPLPISYVVEQTLPVVAPPPPVEPVTTRTPEAPTVVDAVTTRPPPIEVEEGPREILPVDLPPAPPPSIKPRLAPPPLVEAVSRPFESTPPPPASERAPSPSNGGRSTGWVVAALVAVAAVGAFAFRDRLFPPQKDPGGAATIVLTAGTVVLMGPGGVRAPIVAQAPGPDTAAPVSSSAAPVTSSAAPIPSAAVVAAPPSGAPSAAPTSTLKGTLPKPSGGSGKTDPGPAPTPVSTPTKPGGGDRDLGY